MDHNPFTSEIGRLEELDARIQGSHEVRLANGSLQDPIDNNYLHTIRHSRVHLDLVPHAGLVALKMFQLRQNMHLILMQPNLVLANLIAKECDHSAIPYAMIGDQRVCNIPSRGKRLSFVRRTYSLDYREYPDFSSQEARVWILSDHVRSADVLRTFLGDEKVDSASIVSPCLPLVEAHEVPNPMHQSFFDKLPEENRDESSLRFIDDSFDVARRNVAAGGRLLFCQSAENLCTGIPLGGEDLGTHAQYWFPDEENPPLTVLQNMKDHNPLLPTSFTSWTRKA